MTALQRAALEQTLDALPQLYPGPGGVAGVMLDGKVIAQRAWGYRDLTRRLPMTAQVRLPICSISKQFTCGVLLSEVGDPAVLDARLADYLPRFEGQLPSVKQCCDMQSGLRDYWALTVLEGATPEGIFTPDDALKMIAQTRTGHFQPGTQYSYSNCNFRLLPELLRDHTGKELADLYAQHMFGPAGMETAALSPDTRIRVDDVIGYEGNDTTGWFPADNAVYWLGDAGIVASLEDMLAWEGYIDRALPDADSLYARLSAQPYFSDARPASYGFGLKREMIAGHLAIGHGGALRGFRAHRLNIASQRLSVVVILNHEGSAYGAAVGLAKALLGEAPRTGTPSAPRDWTGRWLDEAEGLLADLRPAMGKGRWRLGYGHVPQVLAEGADSLSDPTTTVELGADGDLLIQRPAENLSVNARPLPDLTPETREAGRLIAGTYTSAELEAEALIEYRDGGYFIGFSGLLGLGPMERLVPVAPDVWVMATRRSMDAPPPGDWTVLAHRGAGGGVEALTIGCWLARNTHWARKGN